MQLLLLSKKSVSSYKWYFRPDICKFMTADHSFKVSCILNETPNMNILVDGSYLVFTKEFYLDRNDWVGKCNRNEEIVGIFEIIYFSHNKCLENGEKLALCWCRKLSFSVLEISSESISVSQKSNSILLSRPNLQNLLHI